MNAALSTLSTFANRFKDLRDSSVWVRRFSALAQVWTLIALFIFFSLASESFSRPINLRNILTQLTSARQWRWRRDTGLL